MAYVSNYRKWFGMGFPKKEILIDYINRLCDLGKTKIAGEIGVYVSKTCDFPKKKF